MFPVETEIAVRLVLPENASLPILVTVAGISIDVILVPLNALLPMVSRTLPDSNVTVVRLVLLRNALLPILVTVAGISIDVILVFRNA